jgi:hypothetical protein
MLGAHRLPFDEHACIEASPEHFRLLSSLAKNPVRFRAFSGPFDGIPEFPIRSTEQGSFSASCELMIRSTEPAQN